MIQVLKMLQFILKGRVGVRYMYLYLYLGTVFWIPVSDPYEQEVPGTCTWW